jgi:5-hydroxyisourate hydrolase-like protein (transthyretin family)
MPGWVEAFIVIAAIAIALQTAILVALFVETRTAVRNLTRIITQFQARIDPILIRTNRILEDSESRIASVMEDASELTRLARSQAQKVDRVVTDIAERLRIQVIRADRILTGTLEVIEETGTTLRSKVWQPVHQASAVLKGVKAGLDFLRQRRRPEGETATEDEELFI